MFVRIYLVVAVSMVVGLQLGWVEPSRVQIPEPTNQIVQHYTIDATFDPGSATIEGRLKVLWTNTTGESQDSVPFRLYPNADYYGEGRLEIVGVQVDGHDVLAEGSTQDPTVTWLPIPRAEPGDERKIEIEFVTTVPIDSAGSFGILRGNSDDGSWTLANWYPIAAGWEPGEGWYLDPPTPTGDPTFPTTSSWDVSVRHPDALTLIGTGTERVTSRANGEAATTVSLERGREFTMVALPSDQIAVSDIDVDGLVVGTVLSEGNAIPELSSALEQFAIDAVPRYSDWFGIPLEGELDLVNTDLDRALGVSWSGSIWLDLESLAADGVLDDAEKESLRFVVYHEIGHQWVANILGTNSNEYTFLSEGLVNVLAVAVVREIDGGNQAERAFVGGVAGPYRGFVNGGQDAIADSPVGELSPVVHSLVTYGKGGLGFEATRQEIGTEAFFAALSELGDTYAWDILTPDTVLEAFESASGQDLDELWAFWFEQEETTLEDVDAVIAGAAD